MSRKQKSLVVILVLLIASFIGLNLYKQWRVSSQVKNRPLKIGVILYRGDDEFISSLGREVETAIKQVEETYGEKINVRLLDSKNDQSLQNNQVDTLIRNHYDVICVNMVDRTVSSVIVDKAKQAQIPVVFFNREPVEEDLYKWRDAYYVGTQARESGLLQGQLILEAYERNPEKIDKNKDDKIQYVMLEGEEVHQDSLLRSEASVAAIVEAGVPMEKLARGAANWMRQPAQEFMANWLTTYGDDIEVVLSNNDEMALGAVEALEAAGKLKDGPLVVGIDGTKQGLDAVYKERMLGTVINNQHKQAEAIILLSYALSRDLSPKNLIPELEGRYVTVPHELVTK